MAVIPAGAGSMPGANRGEYTSAQLTALMTEYGYLFEITVRPPGGGLRAVRRKAGAAGMEILAGTPAAMAALLAAHLDAEHAARRAPRAAGGSGG